MTPSTRSTMKPQDEQAALAQQSVRNAVGLMRELAQIMQEEADSLEKQNFADHSELLRRKQRLTLDYRTTMKTFAAQPEMLKSMPEAIRAEIREAAQRLSDMTERNARSLRGAVLGVQRMLQSVMGIIKAEALPQNTYGNLRTQHMQLGKHSPTCKAVAITRTA